MLLPPEIWKEIFWWKRLIEAEERIILRPPIEVAIQYDNDPRNATAWIYKSGNHIWLIRSGKSTNRYYWATTGGTFFEI